MGKFLGKRAIAEKRDNNSANLDPARAKAGGVDHEPLLAQMGTPMGIGIMRALEPRIMLDAAAGASIVDGVEQHLVENAQHWQTAHLDNGPDSPAAIKAQTADLVDGAQDPCVNCASPTEIGFIDSAVENHEVIAASFSPDTRIVFIDGHSDGVEQIASHLNGMSNISAIHIVSHGRSGTLDLGSAKLTQTSINGRYADEMTVIGNALTDTGDILIYGCNFGQYSRGEAAVEALAVATGADIAASNDLTGAANLGGDWELEIQSGQIEVVSINAADYGGVLAPAIISAPNGSLSIVDNVGNPSPVANGVGVGYVATWANAGTVGGAPIDVRATVLSVGPGDTLLFEDPSSIGADDLSVLLLSEGVNNPGEASIRWEIVLAGTTTAAQGSIDLTITDIDGIGGNPNTRETVIPSLSGLTGYSASNPTNIVFSQGANGLTASGTQNQSGEIESVANFQWTNVSSWEVTYRIEPNTLTSGARFTHDGDGDFTFVNRQDNLLLAMDNDGDDSTASGFDNVGAFVENAGAVSVIDSDATITQNALLGAALDGATVKLTNAQLNDIIVVAGLPAGISANIDTAVAGEITVTLSGNASVADYETALKQISFNNNSDTPSTAARLFETSVYNATFGTTSNIAVSTLTVTAVNDVPVAVDDAFSTDEDSVASQPAATGLITPNDTDADGDNLTISAVNGVAANVGNPITLASGALLTVNADGSHSYDPNGQFENLTGSATATDSFDYTVSDGNGGTDTATATITISGVDDSPVLDNDGDDSSLGGPFLDEPLSFISLTGPDERTATGANGSIVSTANGLTSFVAGTANFGNVDPSAHGPDVFPFNPTTVNSILAVQTGTAPTSVDFDLTGYTNTDQLIFFVGNIASDTVVTISGTTSGGVPIDFTGHFNDAGQFINDALTAFNIPAGTNRTPTQMEVVHSTGAGLDTRYAFFDGLPANMESLSVTIERPSGLNEAIGLGFVHAAQPLYDYDTTYTENNPAVSIVDTDVAITDLDSDVITEATITLTNGQVGDVLNIGAMPGGLATIAAPNPPGPLAAAGPISLTIMGNATRADYEAALQAITFRSNSENPDTTDRVVNIQVFENADASNTTTTTIHVVAVNDPPVLDLDGNNSSGINAGNYATSYSENDPVLAIADADTVIQDLDDTNIETATITLTNGQVGDLLSVGNLPAGIALVGAAPTPLLAPGTITVQLTGLAPPSDYQTALQAIGYFSVSEDPDETQRLITVVVNDGDANSNMSTNFIDVAKANDAPTALDDAASTDEDTVLSNPAATGLVAPNDTDPDAADILSISQVNGSAANVSRQITLASGALLTVNADGSYAYNPNGQFENLSVGQSATDSFTYQISDGNGGTDTATVTLTINGANDAPTAVDDAGTTDEDSLLNVPVATGLITPNDSDPDVADILTVSQVNGSAANVGSQITLASGALLTVNADGSYAYDPNGQFESLGVGQTGSDSFSYQISDGNGGTDTANVVLTITGVNDAPLAVDDGPVAAIGGVASNIPVLTGPGADSDPDGDALVVSQIIDQANPGLPINLAVNTPIVLGTGTTITLLPDGSLDILTPLTLGGNESFDYVIDDGNGGTDQATVTLNRTPGKPVINLDQNNSSSGADDGGNAGTYIENAAPISLSDADLLVSDFGLSNLTGLNITIAGNVDGATELFHVGGATFPLDGSGTNTQQVIFGATTFDVLYDSNTTSFTISNSAGAAVPFDDADLAALVSGISFEVTGDTPTAGDRTFEFTVHNNLGFASDPVTAIATVVPVNDPPVAQNDSATTDEDNPVVRSQATGVINPNDSDIENDVLTVTQINNQAYVANTPFALPSGALLTMAPDGSYTYDPNGQFESLGNGDLGADSFTYTISDGNGGTDTATVSLTITGINDAPHIVDPLNPATPPADPNNIIPDVAATDGETPASIVAGDYLADVEGDTLAFSATHLPPGLSINPATGEITGTIDHSASQGGTDPLNNAGVYQTVITADDGNGGLTTTTITYTITNPAPAAADDQGITDEDTTLNGGNVITDVPGSDADTAPDSDGLVVSKVNGLGTHVGIPVAGSTGGLFTINADGSYSFDPNGDFGGLAQGQSRDTAITYQVSDGEGGFDTATVTITVTGVNDGPVATGPVIDQSVTDGETILPVATALAFNNPNADPLSYSASELPPGLSINPNTGEITGTVSSDASLPANYVSTITAQTPGGETATTKIVWHVANINPVANDDNIATPLNTPVVMNLLVNDHDGTPDGDGLSIVSATPPANGAVVINPDGTVTYTPNNGFSGTDSFTYTVSDGQGGTATATATIAVDSPAPNGPVANPLAPASLTDGETIASIDISGDFVDPNGDPLTFAAVNLPQGLTIDPSTGVITGTLDPSASEDGPYLVQVTATDPGGNQLTAPMVVTVTNPGPIAGNDGVDTPLDTPVTITPLANDIDPDGDVLSVALINAQPANGTVAINPDGTLIYKPNPGFSGADSFTYIVEDANGARAEGTVAIVVDGINPHAPTATPMPVASLVDGETIAPIDVTAAFTDPDGDPLTYHASNLPKGLSINPNTGEITGTVDPSASTDGPYSVSVTAFDPAGNQVTQLLTINVTNPAPQAGDDGATTGTNTPVVINVLGNDNDTDGDALTVSATTLPANGTVIINPDGTVTYTPNNGFSGADSFEYTISDADGAIATATVTLNVTDQPSSLGANDQVPPVSAQDGETPAVIDISRYVIDPDGDPLTFNATNLPQGLSIDPSTGQITGTIDNSASQAGDDPVNAPGVYRATITGTDPLGGTTATTLTYTITNIAPVASDDSAIIDEDNGLSGGNVITDAPGADVDGAPDSDDLHISQVDGQNGNVGIPVIGTTGGLFTINTDGSYSFDPDNGFETLAVGESRDTAITYQVSDGEGGFDTATLTVTVTGVNDGPVIIDPQVPITNPNSPPPVADKDQLVPLISGFDTLVITPVDLSIYFHDVDRDGLTYSFANPAQMEDWISLDPVTGEISGTPPADASVGGPGGDGQYPLTITATDVHGATIELPITIGIENLDIQAVSPIPVQEKTVGESTSIKLDGFFRDPDGDRLTYSAEGLPTGLALDPDTGLLSGTLAPTAFIDAPDGLGHYNVIIFATDDQGSILALQFEYQVNELAFVGDDGPDAPDRPVGDQFNPDNLGKISQPTPLIIAQTVNQIEPLGLHVGLTDFDHPITQMLQQIRSLGADTALDAQSHPIDVVVAWINKTNQQLAGSDGYEWLDQSYRTTYQGGDAAFNAGADQLNFETVLSDDLVMLSIAGPNFDPQSWSLTQTGTRNLPGFVQNVDGQAVIILKPADRQSVTLNLQRVDGESQAITIRLDLNSGQLVIENKERISQASTFSEQLLTAQLSPIDQIRQLV